jgi:hypothetical protein
MELEAREPIKKSSPSTHQKAAVEVSGPRGWMVSITVGMAPKMLNTPTSKASKPRTKSMNAAILIKSLRRALIRLIF